MHKLESPLKGLDQNDLSLITRSGQIRSFPKNAVIVMEGDEGNHFYYIRQGRVKIYSCDEEGHEVLLQHLGEGEYFGELALFDDATRSANVMATAKTQLCVVSRGDFLSCIQDNPQLMFKLILGLSGLVRSLTRHIQDLSLLDVYGRLRQTLLSLAGEHDDKRIIDERLTHQDIANHIGSSREMVSRIMKTLVDGEYIRVRQKQIEILKDLPEHW